MEIKDGFIKFLEEKNLKPQAREFEQYFNCSLDEKYNANMARLLTDVAIKHEFAKWIVAKVVNDKYAYFTGYVDARLYSMVLYSVWTTILNADMNAMDKEEARRILNQINLGSNIYTNIDTGCYLKGYTIHYNHHLVPVRMQPGACIHPGYRLFIVNMLCFRDKKVVIGCRCDLGIIRSTTYHKGCRPIGVREDSKGRNWGLMELNADLTDDNLAIFSNALDGDGTMEVCDWVNEYDVRIIYRTDI